MEEETDDKKKCERCSILSEIRGVQIKTTMRTSNGEKCEPAGMATVNHFGKQLDVI